MTTLFFHLCFSTFVFLNDVRQVFRRIVIRARHQRSGVDAIVAQTGRNAITASSTEDRVVASAGVVEKIRKPVRSRQSRSRNSGRRPLGFPILRCVTLISLSTGLLFDVAFGPYCGKETGETALMRQLLDVLHQYYSMLIE